MVLDGLPGLYGFKYGSATTCGLSLNLCSYKLDGFLTVNRNDLGIFLLFYHLI